MSEQTANLCTTDAAESLREIVERQAREIERLKAWKSEEMEVMTPLLDYARSVCAGPLGCSITEWLVSDHKRLAALKAKPSGVVTELRTVVTDAFMGMIAAVTSTTPPADQPPPPFIQSAIDRAVDRIARLNSSPVSADLTASECACGDQYPANSYGAGFMAANNGVCENCDAANSVSAGVVDEREAFEVWAASVGYHTERDMFQREKYQSTLTWELWRVWQARAALTVSAPNHGEQVRDGWQFVPVEPTDAMLEAGDKYIGTPATYKAMLSACPSPAITKDFSQFLSAVMDAAGLIRHGRQSKELSEYLGMKCMEYRGVAPSPGSQKEQE